MANRSTIHPKMGTLHAQVVYQPRDFNFVVCQVHGLFFKQNGYRMIAKQFRMKWPDILLAKWKQGRI